MQQKWSRRWSLFTETGFSFEGTISEQDSLLQTIIPDDTTPHHNNELHFQDNVVPVFINGHKFYTLLDSGASINCISIPTLNRVDATATLLPPEGSFKTVSLEKITPTGRTSLSFTLGPHQLTEEFYVFPSLTQPIILGRPFLSRNKAIMDYKNDTLSIEPDYCLYPLSEVTLAPHSSSLIQCMVHDFTSPDGLTVTTPHSIKYGLEIEASVMQITDNKVPLVVTNPTESEITLNSNMDITTICVMIRDQLPSSITQTTINSLSLDVTEDQPTWNNSMHLTEPLTTHTHAEIAPDTTPLKPDPTFNTTPIPSYPECVTATELTPNTASSSSHPTNDAAQQNVHRSIEEQKTYMQSEYNITFPTNLPNEQLQSLIAVIYKNRHAFIDTSGRIGFNSDVPHVIKIKDNAIPITKQPYRFPPEIKKALQEEIDKLLALDIIERRTNTWASPIIPVKKQTHTRSGKHLSDPKAPPQYRLCLDLRHVNASSIPYVTHINTVPDIIDALGETHPTVFSSLDLKMAFFQQCLSEESRQYCGFLFNGHSYQFRTTPQGLASSPYLFQKLMNTVLADDPLETGFCHVYLDDILIATDGFEMHLNIGVKLFWWLWCFACCELFV